MEMIRKRIKSISLGEIERTKLKKVYQRMMDTRAKEIMSATFQGKKVLDARIWITRVENFYAKKKDIIALLAIHYIVDLESYCRELFNDSTKRTQCLRGLLIKRKKRHDETKREYNKYLAKRKEKTELKLKKSKERLLGEIEWILIHQGSEEEKYAAGWPSSQQAPMPFPQGFAEKEEEPVGGFEVGARVLVKDPHDDAHGFYPARVMRRYRPEFQPWQPRRLQYDVHFDRYENEDRRKRLRVFSGMGLLRTTYPPARSPPSQTSFKPFPVETAEPGKIYLPKDLDKDASKEHQRFCENCKMRKDAHIQTKECLRCPEMPFSLGKPAKRLSETHGSLFKGGRKITHRKKRRKTNPKKSRKRI